MTVASSDPSRDPPFAARGAGLVVERDGAPILPTASDPVPDADRVRVLGLLKRHGWNATSFQILERGFRYWFDGDDACIGYVDTGRAWVAAAPVAPVERFAELATKFAAAARAAKRRACCFATEERFHTIAGWPSLRIGDQPIWRPSSWSEVLKGSKSLREQLRRARAKGVTVRAVALDELVLTHPTRRALDALIERWLASRAIAPMGFLVQVEPFTFPAERRYFIAERDGHIVGFLGVIPIYARHGWFFEDFLRDPNAPNGTVELLVDAGMRAAVAEKIDHATFGLVPLAGEVGAWLRAARKWGRALYDFDGLRAFKAKLKPSGWDPIFLAYPPGKSGVVAIIDALTAFARGGLLRFGIETALRGPAIVMRLLAGLLVAWTLLLALPIATPYFPSPTWQWAWVSFDVVLAIALFALSTRWRQPLGDIIAATVTADAITTLIQVIAFDAPRRSSVAHFVILGIAVAAPTFAAVMLWNARTNHSRSERQTNRSRPP